MLFGGGTNAFAVVPQVSINTLSVVLGKLSIACLAHIHVYRKTGSYKIMYSKYEVGLIT